MYAQKSWSQTRSQSWSQSWSPFFESIVISMRYLIGLAGSLWTNQDGNQMIVCLGCGRSLRGRKRISTRKWCSLACRGEARRKQARERFEGWLLQKLPDEPPDLELLLLALAPDGAWWYRLSCPGLQNGTPRYFPVADAWCMRPHEPPAVPWSGVYSVCFYVEHMELLTVCDGVAVVLATDGVKIGSGDHRLHIERTK